MGSHAAPEGRQRLAAPAVAQLQRLLRLLLGDVGAHILQAWGCTDKPLAHQPQRARPCKDREILQQ